MPGGRGITASPALRAAARSPRSGSPAAHCSLGGHLPLPSRRCRPAACTPPGHAHPSARELAPCPDGLHTHTAFSWKQTHCRCLPRRPSQNCERLSLSTNAIEKMCPLNNLPKLKILSLGRNRIGKIEHLHSVRNLAHGGEHNLALPHSSSARPPACSPPSRLPACPPALFRADAAPPCQSTAARALSTVLWSRYGLCAGVAPAAHRPRRRLAERRTRALAHAQARARTLPRARCQALRAHTATATPACHPAHAARPPSVHPASHNRPRRPSPRRLRRRWSSCGSPTTSSATSTACCPAQSSPPCTCPTTRSSHGPRSRSCAS